MVWKYYLTPVVCVFLCNFEHSALPSKAVTIAGITDYEPGEHIGNYTRYVYIQLPFFSKQEEDCVTSFDQWTYNIKYMGPMQNVAFTRQNAVFQRLANVGNVASLSESERRLYEVDLKFARNHYAHISDAHEEGIRKGIEKGMEKSIRTAAVGFLRLNQPVELVANATGLTIEEVKQLKSKIDSES